MKLKTTEIWKLLRRVKKMRQETLTNFLLDKKNEITVDQLVNYMEKYPKTYGKVSIVMG